VLENPERPIDGSTNQSKESRMPVGGIAMAVGGGILVLLGVLARMGVLTRQRVVGLRTEATMASDEAWQAAHQSAAIWVVVAGIVLFLGGVSR
jgi:uncharacterized membrane protein